MYKIRDRVYPCDRFLLLEHGEEEMIFCTAVQSFPFIMPSCSPIAIIQSFSERFGAFFLV